MIREVQGNFILETEHTSYLFRVLENGQLEHLYYGTKIVEPEEAMESALSEKHAFLQGNQNVYRNEYPSFSLENCLLEMSSYGKGDIREPFVEMTFSNGCSTCDFRYDSYEIREGKEAFATLPGSYGTEAEVQQLKLTLKEAHEDVVIELYYYVYEKEDVIARSAKCINQSTGKLQLNRLMSMQLDLEEQNLVFHTFTGAWAREMMKNDIPLKAGKYVNSSYTGTTSSRANSFVMLSREHTTQDQGECMGFHLVYSGNHMEVAEVSPYGKIRFLSGINPTGGSFLLAPGECFEAPEAFFTYSNNGFNGMSQNLHGFIRKHIVRGEYQFKERPILLNSWEAAYFNINEKKLLELAKAGKELGIELFVMDDGWFGERNDDTSSLGDWEENREKLPGGIQGIASKVKALGMDFGLWVEPEMISVNSKLYREHPEYAIEVPDREHSEGRHQRILDLCNPEVQDYVIEAMTKVFSFGEISYVKWDMNRTFTDYYSKYLASLGKQGEVAHRYVCGLYRCMEELTERFPHILFEGCAAGGNRFDPGMLCYFPQIWASDNTDALCRGEMQNSYSYGYPLSVIGAHVSGCPNHQTLRNTPLDTRFAVAAFGCLGYECNLSDMGKIQTEMIKEQIALYKEWRKVFQFGTFYRGRELGAGYGESMLRNLEGNLQEWTVVSEEGKQAVGLLLQKLVIPNHITERFFAKGLREEKKYHFTNRELKYNLLEFGDLVNTVSPVHIKQDSMAHKLVARFVKMDGEKENLIASGSLLMHGGVKLKSAFAATGYDGETRYFPDFACRMYFMNEIE